MLAASVVKSVAGEGRGELLLTELGSLQVPFAEMTVMMLEQMVVNVWWWAKRRFGREKKGGGGGINVKTKMEELVGWSRESTEQAPTY